MPVETEKTRSITIHLSEMEWELLAVLDEHGSVQKILYQLIDNAQQGVFRPGSWQRMWIAQGVGDSFEDRLEPGDPFRREGGEKMFQRPRTIPGKPLRERAPVRRENLEQMMHRLTGLKNVNVLERRTA